VSSNLVLRLSKFNLRMDKSAVQKIYEFEDFRFDAEHLMLYRRGEAIPLAPKAAEALLVFIERRGQILSKKELIEQIWPMHLSRNLTSFFICPFLERHWENRKTALLI
jgi:DNA-binding response OmpR family regulator